MKLGKAQLVRKIALGLATFFVISGFSTAGGASAAGTSSNLAGEIKDVTSTPLSGVRIDVTGPNGFATQITSDAMGKWQVEVNSTGIYDVTLDQSSLPSGQALTDVTKATRKINVLMLGSTLTVLFPIGPGAEKTPILDQSAQLLADGLILGIIIALAALGLNLVFGTTGLTNFAHGELLTLGGLLTYFFSAIAGLPVFAAIPVAVALSAFIGGYLQDRLLWKPLRKRGTGLIAMLVVSIGFAIFVRYVFLFIFGGDTRQLPEFAGQAGLEIGLVSITPKSIMSTSVGLLLLIGATLWLLRSKMGKASRAVADNPALAAASGIEVEAVIRSVWILGAFLAAFAGIMVTLNQGVSFLMGQDMLLLIFASVTLGGLGTAYGALVGSLVIGVLIQLSTLIIPTELKYVGALLILIIILLVRPQGILGRKERVG